MAGNEEIDQSIRPLVKLSREHIVRAQKLDYALVSSLERDPLLAERLKRLRTVPGVGPITALTWALEIGIEVVSLDRKCLGAQLFLSGQCTQGPGLRQALQRQTSSYEARGMRVLNRLDLSEQALKMQRCVAHLLPLLMDRLGEDG
jgi:hypothetical protein